MKYYALIFIYVMLVSLLSFYVVLATLNVTLWQFIVASMYGIMVSIVGLIPIGITYYLINRKH